MKGVITKPTVRLSDETAIALALRAERRGMSVPAYILGVLDEHVQSAPTHDAITALADQAEQNLLKVNMEVMRLRADMSAMHGVFQKHLEQGLAHELDVHIGELKKLMRDFFAVLQSVQGAPSSNPHGVPDYRKVPSSDPYSGR